MARIADGGVSSSGFFLQAHRMNEPSKFKEQTLCRKPFWSAPFAPVCRAPKGALSTDPSRRPGRIALRGALDRIPELDRAEIDDVILGCAQPEGEQVGTLPAGRPCARVCRMRFRRNRQHALSSALKPLRVADLRIRGRRPGSGGGRSGIDEPAAHGRPETQPQSRGWQSIIPLPC